VEGAGEVSVEAVKEGSTFSRESVDPCARALLVYICPFIVSSSHIKNYTIRHSTYTTMTHVARFLAVSDTSLPRSYYTPLPLPGLHPDTCRTPCLVSIRLPTIFPVRSPSYALFI